MRILMVCLGNICRSPLAEGILRHKVNKAGLDWEIDSAGTSGHQPGCAPHYLSQKIAKLNGVSICEQRCRNFRKDDIDHFDKIYVMDDDNYSEVKRITGKKWDETKVDYVMNLVHPGQDRNVPDPWYGGEDGFHRVYEMLDKACEALIRKYHTSNAGNTQIAS